MARWRKIRVKEVCSLIVDCVNRTAPTVEQPTDYKMIRTTNVRDGRINLSDCRHVDANTFESWTRRAAVLDGDVILTREAPIGEVGFVKDLGNVFLGQRIMQYRANSSVLDPRFLFYSFRSPSLQAQFASHDGSGSVVSHIRVADCHEFELDLPTLEVQQHISRLLGSLDDKIELNRQMNETLETMARAIFKDWFVDFGPTRAKMEGRAPYLASDIWSLFPDRLDDEGKPEGWAHVPLSALIEVNPSEALARGSPAAYLDMASIPTVGPNPDPYVIREFGSGMRFRNGDALLARITPCLENGKSAFVQNLPEGEVGWGSTEFIVLRARAPLPKAVSYIVARDPAFRANAIRSMTGTSGRQRASNVAISEFQLIRPNENLVWTALGSLIDPMFARIVANDRECQTLADTRDFLLPKLMSGEVSVIPIQVALAESK
ncbi:restriction endonuclease subunit S [Aquidulcibacter paucihalophilus]|uniref:restriction endonuclease subunit S n=1 Tax=Aquidulcibacter paucihalophilus TaxID=1978549 RepID=UPI0022B79006|nr:restriction endonuclease subunit S [Aquidulcibacter paucihalophilus]